MFQGKELPKDHLLQTVTFSEPATIYPNPAYEVLYITNKSKENLKTEIADINGQIIYSSEISYGDLKINVSGFAKGIYILKISSNDKIQTQKLLIE